jgi:hypothetical protein
MILYSLQCAQGHGFDEWFSNSAEYDRMKADGELECPECHGHDVTKAIMAPSLGGQKAAEPMAQCAPHVCGGCSHGQ